MLEELNILFESETIKPTFEYVHIILSLYIFGENSEGIGRYRLQKELNIGSGTARSLITKLKEKSNFIKVMGDNNRKGHILTNKGQNFLLRLKEKIPERQQRAVGASDESSRRLVAKKGILRYR